MGLMLDMRERMLKRNKRNIASDLQCDGQSLDLGNGPNMEGIALLNIPSIYGGTNLWGDPSRRKKRGPTLPLVLPQIATSPTESLSDLSSSVQDMGDRLIEVVGLESAIQVGQIKAGVRGARRLSQCSSVVIR